MSEIKCPKCGEVFTVDQSAYAEILLQIKNQEFEKEVQTRLHSLKVENDAKVALLEEKNKREQEKMISQLKTDLLNAQHDLEMAKKENKHLVEQAVNEKDKKIDELNNQLLLKDKEYALEENKLKEQHAFEIKQKDSEIEL